MLQTGFRFFYNGAFIEGESLKERGRELEHFWYLVKNIFFEILYHQ